MNDLNLFNDIAATLRQLADQLEQVAQAGPQRGAAASSPKKSQPLSVEAALAARDVRTRSIAAVGRGEQALFPVAMHIASTYPRCAPLLAAIKRAQGTTRGVSLDLKKQSQADVSAITTLGTLASRAQLLPDYKYRPSPTKVLTCSAPVTPLAIRFFTGGWLELHAFAALEGVANDAGWRIEPRVNITLPNEDQFELDIAMAGPKGKLIWLEAKTGNNFAALLPKYRSMTKVLGTGESHAFLLAPELTGSPLEVAAASAGMTPVTLEDFVDVISGRLG